MLFHDIQILDTCITSSLFYLEIMFVLIVFNSKQCTVLLLLTGVHMYGLN